jgi:Ca2+-binding RTX toxin-like protein
MAAITITGTPGGDILRGLVLSELLLGLPGDDSLYGAGADDTLDGGLGNDRLFGGTDNDTAVGGAGNDTAFGGTGNDLRLGGDGRDCGDTDVIDLIGLGVLSGLGTATVTFTNGAELSASNDYLWTATDFI